ncbi:MAG: signal peptidase I [Acidimicrobiia bacterium]
MTAPAGTHPPESEPEVRAKRGTRQLIEWMILIAAALALALLVQTFLVKAFYIPSESMVPTLNENDRVLVNKLSYKFHDVHRGDIVVFKAPEGEESGVKDLVKRVIGLPGDNLAFRDGAVYVNGALLDEDYLPEGTVTSQICNVASELTVPANSYYMMGDNRQASRDSRCFDAIPEGDIVGRVFFKMWPLSDLSFM